MKENRQQVYLPLPYREKLRSESTLTGRGISEIVRRALDEYWGRNGQWNGDLSKVIDHVKRNKPVNEQKGT